MTNKCTIISQIITLLHRLVSNYQLNAHFLYSITICMLHYNPRHVSSSTLLIFRRTDCIITASGIVTLCKQPYSMPVERGLQSAINRHTVRLFTDDTRCCNIQFFLLKMSKVLLETCRGLAVRCQPAYCTVATIPDAVIIKFVLLKMSIVLLEIFSGL